MRSAASFENALRALAVALVLIAIALAAHRAFWSNAGRVIDPSGPPPWIMLDTPVLGALQQWGRIEPPVGRFSREFVVEDTAEATLRARAFGDLTLRLDGRELALPDDATSWRQLVALDVSRSLEVGRNRIDAEVRNLHGPPLLSLSIEGPGVSLSTGPDWQGVDDDGTPVATRIADDRRPYPDAHLGEAPLAALAGTWPLWSALAAAGALGFALLRRRHAGAAPWLLPATLCGVGLAWLYLFAAKFVDIDLRTGFDAPRHLFYFESLRSNGRVPLATDDFSTYHPPLFYLASLLMAELARGVGVAREVGLKLLPFLAGLGNVGLAAVLARRLEPGRPGIVAACALFAGLLPMNVYIAAYFSNEPLHAFLGGGTLVLAVSLLLDDEIRVTRLAGFSTLLGLALLTKFTALTVAGPAALAVGLRVVHDARRGRLAALPSVVALVLPALAVAGWFYARNAFEYGQLVYGNWDLDAPGLVWWSHPGFHTWSYYAGFGEVFVRPFLSGYLGFWDALYSTLWGDGFLAGMGPVRARHPAWRYDLMSAGYLLAIPATGLLVVGFAHAIGRSLRDPAPRRRAAWALLVLTTAGVGFAIFHLTLALPYVGQAKAFYGLTLTPAIALFLASGAARADRWLARVASGAGRAIGFAWLSAFLGVVLLTYALPGLPEVAAVYAETHVEVGDYSRAEGRFDEAKRHYGLALGANPDLAGAHRGMAAVLREEGDRIGAIARYRRAVELEPERGETYLALADTLLLAGRAAEAVRHYRSGLERLPRAAEGHHNLGVALRSQGQRDQAIAAFRRALELNPDYDKARRNLDRLLSGDP